MTKKKAPEPAGAGRPTELKEGKPVRVYLDMPSLETARSLGDGNISAGIRAALVQAQKKLNRARKEK